MNQLEKKLFLQALLPRRDLTNEGLKGHFIYDYKKNTINEKLLAEAFQEEYNDFKTTASKRGVFSLFDKTNYAYEYLFKNFNNKNKDKIIPGHIVGFKAEKAGQKNILKASIRMPDGLIENKVIEVSPLLDMSQLNFNIYALIYLDTLCVILTEKEYNELIATYFPK